VYKAPRGTEDILPEEQHYWRFIEQKAADISRLYGYQRLETPVFEDSQLFLRSVGEGTDIVTKEMYIFKDRSENSLALRPEGTAPVCRAYVEHGMDNLPQPVKLSYLATIFRYERPQAGRYRQHHQFGFEAIGDASPLLDAEVIDMAWHYFVSMGLKDISLQLNSIGCRQCRPDYLKKLVAFYSDHKDNLCEDCRTRYEKNPLRLLDCKRSSCQATADAAPKSVEHLCPECAAHFQSVQGYLNEVKLPFNVNHRLVRGLDYYTRTVFEIQPLDEGGQSTLGGGGRYDYLIEQLSGKPTPAIGFASGIERVVLNLKKQQVAVPLVSRPQVYIATMGEKARLEAIKLSGELHSRNIGAMINYGDRSLKAQLRQANNLAVSRAIIIGEDEVNKGIVVVRDMKTGEQTEIDPKELADRLLAEITGGE
jgi:histidyl-tRNA synthetase